MGGRWKLWLASGVLVGMVGCSRPFARPKSPGNGPLLSSNTNTKEDKFDPKAPMKVETMMAFAEIKLAAARDPNKSSRDRESLFMEARKAYQGVLDRQPGNLVATAGLAKSYSELGDKEKALEIYRRATETHGHEAGLWYEMGLIQGQLQDWDAAIQSFNEAVRLEPDNRSYRTWLGFTLARVGRVDDGFAWLKKGRTDAEARYLPAKLMLQASKEEASKVQLTLALRADPNYQPALELIASLSPAETSTPDTPSSDIQPVRYETPALPRAEMIGIPQKQPASVGRSSVPPPVLLGSGEK